MDSSNFLQRRALAGATAADFYVSTLPDLEPAHALSLSSGYLPARPPRAGAASSSDAADDAHLFFLLERARHTPTKRRLIVWLNGGPGCSSFDGVLMEVGAFRPNDKGGLEWATPGGAWNEYADVLYLDQPVGTGFSYVSTSGYTTSLQQAADEVLYFLKRFIEVYPEYRRGEGVDVYVAGESFAGQYIPYVANTLNEAGRSSPVDLKGIAIGNGYIDPIAQYGTELDMMVEAKIWDTSSEEYGRINKIKQNCRKALDSIKGDPPRWIDECEDLLSDIVSETTHKIGGRNTCINIYDVRLSDESPACGMNWPPLVAPMYKYLDREDVRKALHVDKTHKPEAWIECNKRVGSRLNDKGSKASVVHLPKLLESGIKVMLFAGDQDLICNHIGVERVPERLQWGGSGWGNPPKVDWYVNNSMAGYWRTNRNLTYVSIAGGSHMVPFDKPVETHDMMLRFMGVDLLAAAGPSARIPSRLGDEKDRMVLIGGGGGTEKDDRPMIPGVDGKTEAQVAEEAKWAAYYNAGSAALIVLILLVGAGACVLLRLRRRSRAFALPERRDENHELEHLVVDGGEDRYSDEATGSRKQSDALEVQEEQEIFDVGDESDDEGPKGARD